MIAQLTPDEARIIKSIDREEYALVNVYDYAPDGTDRLVGSRTQLGIGIGIDETRQQQYLSNLDRLGIRINVRSSNDVEGVSVLFSAIKAEFPGRGAHSTDESIEVTPFGQQFLDTCVRDRDVPTS